MMIDYEHRTEQRNGRIIALMVVASLMVIGGFLAFARWSSVLANTPDINNARSLYGITGTRIDSCSLCHTASIPTLNPFGAAYLSAGRNTAALIAVNSTTMDSDGDGFSNNAEIVALTFPGDPADHPVAATVAPTSTNTPTNTLTSTPTTIPPTATNTPTSTPTGVPPTATNTPTSTVTGVPPTATNTPTATLTGVPPTATNTPMPTSTGMPPTATVNPTRTGEPTERPEPTETEEPEHHQTPTMRPTETEEHHQTPTMMPTRPPKPTSTVTCRKDDDQSSNDGKGGGDMKCTPVPEHPRPTSTPKPTEGGDDDHSAAVPNQSAGGYLDVNLW